MQIDSNNTTNINFNEISPSRILDNRIASNNYLDSDSSLSSPKLPKEQVIAN